MEKQLRASLTSSKYRNPYDRFPETVIWKTARRGAKLTQLSRWPAQTGSKQRNMTIEGFGDPQNVGKILNSLCSAQKKTHKRFSRKLFPDLKQAASKSLVYVPISWYMCRKNKETGMKNKEKRTIETISIFGNSYLLFMFVCLYFSLISLVLSTSVAELLST